MITKVVAVAATLAAASRASSLTVRTVVPAADADKTRTSLHQEVDLKATPERIYEILLDSKLFTAFSGLPAEVSAAAGGRFSMFRGQIEGRNIELVPGQRIVQAWRPAHWDPGVYSIVRFELRGHEASTHVVLDHTGFPEGDAESLGSGWKEHYWDRLTKYLGT